MRLMQLDQGLGFRKFLDTITPSPINPSVAMGYLRKDSVHPKSNKTNIHTTKYEENFFFPWTTFITLCAAVHFPFGKHHRQHYLVDYECSTPFSYSEGTIYENCIAFKMGRCTVMTQDIIVSYVSYVERYVL
ncbi:uncharacterized protein LOC143227913 [Tachypleus tridentatus]|uniref:uncharacterized protein LOC143227913 n=1 Tax=Tachypleus tridentatus TaxID=6853 RepID=UPI003FD54152